MKRVTCADVLTPVNNVLKRNVSSELRMDLDMPRRTLSDDKSELKIDPNAAWLREGLKKHGKTQRGLAKFLEVDDATVHRMVNGGRSIRHGELQRIAIYLGEALPRGSAIKTVPVRGVLVEGAWRIKMDDHLVKPSQEKVAAIPSRVPAENQFAYEIISPGQPSQVEYFVSPDDLGRDIREDDEILVQEERGDMIREVRGAVKRTVNGLAVAPAGGAHRDPMLLADLVLVGVSIGTFIPRNI